MHTAVEICAGGKLNTTRYSSHRLNVELKNEGRENERIREWVMYRRMEVCMESA